MVAIVVYSRMKWCKWWQLGIPPAWLVICGAILVQVVFGMYPVVVRRFASTAEPLIVAFYQDVGCFPLLFVCALTVERKLMFPGIKMLLVFMFLGLTGQFGSHLLYILGVYWAGAAPTNAIQPITPVFTTILAIATCTEKRPSPFHVHTWIKLLGILLSVGGAIELVLTAKETPSNGTAPSNFSGMHNSTSSPHHSLSLLGYLAIILGSMTIAIYVVIQKRFIFNSTTNKWRDHPIYVTAYSYMFGALFMCLASIYYLASDTRREKFILEGTGVYVVVYAIFLTSAVGSLLLTWTNMHLSPTLITAFFPRIAHIFYLVLVTVIASYFINDTELAPYQYIGAVMVLVALFMVLFSNHMEERLRDGKSVLRLDCHMTSHTRGSATDHRARPASGHSTRPEEDGDDQDEKTPLLTRVPDNVSHSLTTIN